MNTKKSKYYMLLMGVGLLFTLASCGTKETALLQTEDLVMTEDELPEAVDAGANDVLASGAETAADGNKLPMSEGEADIQEKEQAESSVLYIHICGAVESPGVYELPAGSRVYDAVTAAGGFSEEAAEDYVNLAQEPEDGWKIVIPTVEEAETMKAAGEDGSLGEAAWQETAGQSNDQPAGKAGRTAGLININMASKEELMQLPGIGESRAEAIVQYREKQGEFAEPEDIMNIEGIKSGMYEKLKDKITVR